MESKKRVVKLAEIGAAVVVGLGALVGLKSYIEAEAQRPHILYKGNNLEVYGQCLANSDSNQLEALIQPGERAAISGDKKYLIMAKTNIALLSQEAKQRGSNFEGAVSAGETFVPGNRPAGISWVIQSDSFHNKPT